MRTGSSFSWKPTFISEVVIQRFAQVFNRTRSAFCSRRLLKLGDSLLVINAIRYMSNGNQVSIRLLGDSHFGTNDLQDKKVEEKPNVQQQHSPEGCQFRRPISAAKPAYV